MTNNNHPIYQLRYSLTREDIAAFEFMPRELHGAEKLWLFAPVLACGAAAGLFEDQLRAILPWDPGSRWGQLLTVLIAVAIGYGLSLLLLTMRVRRRIANAPLPESATRVDVYPEALFVSQDDDENRSYVWSESAIVDTPGHVFITQGTRKPVIIPARAFDSLEAMRAFVSDARFWREAGQVARDRIEENGEVES